MAVYHAISMHTGPDWDLDNGCLSTTGLHALWMSLSATDTCILKDFLNNHADEIDAAAAIELKNVRMVNRGIEQSRIVSDDTVEGTIEGGGDIA